MGRVLDASCFEDGFWEGFDGFWEDFERILEGCWGNVAEAGQVSEITLMIRATRGRSSRPNHMPGRLDALQTTGTVTFRRFPGSFHSVAKQASF